MLNEGIRSLEEEGPVFEQEFRRRLAEARKAWSTERAGKRNKKA
jgi:hypothetical protein